MTNPQSKVAQFLTPSSLISAARAAHPAFKFAIVVAGLAALVSVISRFGVSLATIVFGVIALVVLMVLFVVFAQAAVVLEEEEKGGTPAMVLIWSFLSLTIISAFLLGSSAFFDWPLPLRTGIVNKLNGGSIENKPTPSAEASLHDLQKKMEEITSKHANSSYVSPELNRAINNARRYMILFYFKIGEAVKAKDSDDACLIFEMSKEARMSMPDFETNVHLIPSIQASVNFYDQVLDVLDAMQASPDFPQSKKERLDSHRQSLMAIRKVYVTLINAIQNPESNWEEKNEILKSMEDYDVAREFSALTEFFKHVSESV